MRLCQAAQTLEEELGWEGGAARAVGPEESQEGWRATRMLSADAGTPLPGLLQGEML